MSKAIEGVIANPNAQITNYFRKMFNIELKNFSDDPKVLVLGGGADVNPALFFEEEAVATTVAQLPQDMKEIRLLFEARMAEIPVIGICRGFQMGHVSFGGRLTQHINGHRTGSHVLYNRDPKTGAKSTSNIMVNSSHHQAVPEMQAALIYEEMLLAKEDKDKTYFAESGFSKKKRFFGVQWHPEREHCPKPGREYFENKVEELLTAGV